MSKHEHPYGGPDAESTTRVCNQCGTHVSRSFVRVFGDNDDNVYACLECATLRDLQEGVGTHPGGRGDLD